MKVVFYGAGNMASAIFKGMIESGLDPSCIYLTSKKLGKKHEKYESKLGVNISMDDSQLLKHATYLILATKPQQFESAALRIRPFLEEDTKIVSIMAGTTIDTIREVLEAKSNQIARIMPNTNASVRHAVNGIAFSDNFTNKEELEDLMAMFGENVIIDESKFNKITAATGSGPAFLYYLYEQYTNSLVDLGFNREEAEKLTKALVIGTGEMMKSTDLSLSELRGNITSQKGTTHAGLESLSEYDIQKIFRVTLEAAKKRGEELSKD